MLLHDVASGSEITPLINHWQFIYLVTYCYDSYNNVVYVWKKCTFKAVLLLWITFKAVLLLRMMFAIYVLCLSCFLVCSLQPCGHLLKKGKPLDPLVCDVFLCFVIFPYCVLGQVWRFIVSIPDLCLLPYSN